MMMGQQRPSSDAIPLHPESQFPRQRRRGGTPGFARSPQFEYAERPIRHVVPQQPYPGGRHGVLLTRRRHLVASHVDPAQRAVGDEGLAQRPHARGAQRVVLQREILEGGVVPAEGLLCQDADAVRSDAVVRHLEHPERRTGRDHMGQRRARGVSEAIVIQIRVRQTGMSPQGIDEGPRARGAQVIVLEEEHHQSRIVP